MIFRLIKLFFFCILNLLISGLNSVKRGAHKFTLWPIPGNHLLWSLLFVVFLSYTIMLIIFDMKLKCYFRSAQLVNEEQNLSTQFGPSRISSCTASAQNLTNEKKESGICTYNWTETHVKLLLDIIQAKPRSGCKPYRQPNKTCILSWRWKTLIRLLWAPVT